MMTRKEIDRSIVKRLRVLWSERNAANRREPLVKVVCQGQR